MERLSTNRRPAGITVNALRTWGVLFLVIGIAGRGVLQTHVLKFTGMNTQQMLEAMQTSGTVMANATLSLVLQALEVCAVPIFAMLLVEGVLHTSDFKAYFLRVLGTAVLSEIPYNLAIGGKLFDLSSRNPVFATVLAMVLLYFFRRYGAPGFRGRLFQILLTVAALVWARMLGIEFGGPMVLMVCVLWVFRGKVLLRNFAGATAAIVCSLFSPFFLASPMAFLAIHMCNGERNEDNRLLNYLLYPAVLLLVGIVCPILF